MNKTIDFSILLLDPVTLYEYMITKRLGHGKEGSEDAREIKKSVQIWEGYERWYSVRMKKGLV